MLFCSSFSARDWKYLKTLWGDERGQPGNRPQTRPTYDDQDFFLKELLVANERATRGRHRNGPGKSDDEKDGD